MGLKSISSQLRRPKTWDSIYRDHLTLYTLAFRHMSDVWPFSAITSDWTWSISVSRDLFVCMMACHPPKANKRTSDTTVDNEKCLQCVI